VEQENFKEFSAILCRWYAAHKRDLPWRGENNPYYVWLSEIILQQTRVSQGLPYYLNFVKAFPTVADLAHAPEEKVLKTWQGLGYYSRARNLQHAAQYITNELKGVFPTTYEGLLALKGVGEYTASAIASISYNQPKAVVDGNVYRVLSRIFDIETPINTSEGVKYFRSLAYQLLDKEKPGEYNQAIMEFGALQCKPQLPDCPSCVMNAKCLAYHRGKVEKLPVKLPKVKIKHRYFHYCVQIDPNGYSLLKKREGKDIWQGLYEFPLWETEVDIPDYECALLLKGQFPRATQVRKYPKTFLHKLTHQHLHVSFWEIYLPEPIENGQPYEALKGYPVPAIVETYIDLVIEECLNRESAVF
jgi:A/G-specific adenine glycosylase